MNQEDVDLSEKAYKWICSNKKLLIKTFANPEKFEKDVKLISLFMAGSPGAGKTEVSRRLVENFNKQPVIIDADEIRKICPGYKGFNADVFQKAATKGVNMLSDFVISNDLNVIIDGTFAYAGVMESIKRSIKHGRKVVIYFVYQDPVQAWEFTKKREEIESRKVTKDIFIRAFIKSRENANLVKQEFGGEVELNLIIKNVDNSIERIELNISGIDQYIKKGYTQDELNKIII